MILTGMLIYIPSSFRASIATMLTVVSIANLNFFSPHKNKSLFWLTELSFIVTCFKYITALMIGNVVANDSGESTESFGYIMIVLDVTFMVSAALCVVVSIYIIHVKIKKMRSVKVRLKSVIRKNASRMKSKKWLQSLRDMNDTNTISADNDSTTNSVKSWTAQPSTKSDSKSTTKVVPVAFIE
jgi:hypothetical protein